MTLRTLFAGFVFNFSKIFSDCCLDASPLILATEDVRRWGVEYWIGLQCRKYRRIA